VDRYGQIAKSSQNDYLMIQSLGLDE